MNLMMMLQNILGNKYGEMMAKWNAMSPEQKQAEMNKISSMSQEDRMNYLKNMGIDISKFQQNTPSQNNGGNRFSY